MSALVLSLVDEQGSPQDGFLRAHEVYNLNLPAELVVLSACQTGLDKEIKGEGLVGLTRGFMYAGAARVVVSLWSVNDRATSELIAKFYQKMLKGAERPAAALRSAQVEMWRSSQWKAPYFWAAFVLQGEWRWGGRWNKEEESAKHAKQAKHAKIQERHNSRASLDLACFALSISLLCGSSL